VTTLFAWNIYDFSNRLTSPIRIILGKDDSASLFRNPKTAQQINTATVAFFIIRFFLFLASVGSLTQSTQKGTTTEYPIENQTDLEKTEKPALLWESITKRCYKCGATSSSRWDKCPYCGNEFQTSENLSNKDANSSITSGLFCFFWVVPFFQEFVCLFLRSCAFVLLQRLR